MSTDNAILLRDSGIPNIYAMNGVDVSVDDTCVTYQAFQDLCSVVMLSQCLCDVKLTADHLRLMCNELDWPRACVAHTFDETLDVVTSWFSGSVNIPIGVQSTLKYKVLKNICPNMTADQHADLVSRKAPEKFEFTYDEESNSWTWSNMPNEQGDQNVGV